MAERDIDYTCMVISLYQIKSDLLLMQPNYW